jgi:acyl-CoA thioesterase-1
MNLSAIISAMQDAHAKVILGGITLPPNYGSDYIAKFNAIYLKESKVYHVPLLPFMLKGVYGVAGSMQDDGIHPTAQGCKQVAKNFLPLLLPMLHKPAHDHARSSGH